MSRIIFFFWWCFNLTGKITNIFNPLMRRLILLFTETFDKKWFKHWIVNSYSPIQVSESEGEFGQGNIQHFSTWHNKTNYNASIAAAQVHVKHVFLNELNLKTYIPSSHVYFLSEFAKKSLKGTREACMESDMSTVSCRNIFFIQKYGKLPT